MKRIRSGSWSEAVLLEVKTGLVVFFAPAVAVGRAIANTLTPPDRRPVVSTPPGLKDEGYHQVWAVRESTIQKAPEPIKSPARSTVHP